MELYKRTGKILSKELERILNKELGWTIRNLWKQLEWDWKVTFKSWEGFWMKCESNYREKFVLLLYSYQFLYQIPSLLPSYFPFL